jgi:hypothetical protein
MHLYSELGIRVAIGGIHSYEVSYANSLFESRMLCPSPAWARIDSISTGKMNACIGAASLLPPACHTTTLRPSPPIATYTYERYA